MTALCGGATSSSKPDFSRYISITTGGAGFLLRNTGNAWAVAFGALIGLINYDLNAFCTTDPPAMPTITAEDCVAILNPLGGPSYFVAQKKFQDLIANYAWPEYCQCDSGPQPGTPAPVTPPTDVPQLDPVTPLMPDPTLAVPCITYPQTSRDFGGAQVFPTTDPYNLVNPLTGFFMRFKWHPGTGAVAVNFHYTVTFQDAAHSTISTTPAQLVIAGFSDYTMFWQLPPLTEYFVITWGTPSTTSAGYFTLDVDGYCSGEQAGGTVGPCCPPDSSILALLTNVTDLVTLIQRQAVPFAYVTSTVHSGLTGTGHIDVADLIGIKLQVDSYGSAVGQLAGDPTEFYDAGWFAWGGPDGYSSRQFITHSPQISLPAAAGQYTSIGYSLGHDVVVTITELVREP